jgi:hypothetical protein
MSDSILISTRKGLFTASRGNGGWKIASENFLGDNVTLTLYDRRDGATYAALNHGHFGVKLHRKGRNGKWEEIATPAYPPKPEGLVDLDGWGKPVNWTTQMIWALEPGGDDQPGTLWAGTMPGGLFRSNDRGASWELIRPLWEMPQRNKWLGGGADIPGIHSICVDPRSSNTVRVGVSCGGVWTTHDGGETWACTAQGMHFDEGPTASDPEVQDPHMLVQCKGSPDRLWVQHHCGIYISRDGSKSWQEVKAKPSSFGFGVVVHPRDPDTAWFVPGIKDEKRYPVDGKLVVTRTRDGGKSFDVLKNGLPQDHSYDLIYRHALAIDETGDKLAFGSTTGGLWASNNQGDDWQLLSHTLPPVHAVRFGG